MERNKEHHSSVLITGASSGIGKQLAIDYAQAGYHVWACGRDKDKLNQIAQTSNNILTLCFDINNLEQAKASLQELSPMPSLWIYNAGSCEYIDNGIMDAELTARVIQTNVIGLVNSIEASQHHYQAGHRLVIIGSIASELAMPRAEAYGASKAAVSYISRSLALDLRQKNIHVTTVFPGFVKTPLTDKNTFPMPMMITVENASIAIRKGIEKRRSTLYFPRTFTSILRLLALLPYGWQQRILQKLIGSH